MNQRQHETPSEDADTAPSPEVDDDQHTVDHHQDTYQQAQAFITPAMQAFAEHWAHNRNQIKAYQFAYPRASVATARAEARRLFADPRIQAEIHRVTERYVDHTRATLAHAEQVLSRLALADIRRLFDRNGNLLSPHQWDADTAAAVASYKETPTKDGMVRTVRLHDKHAAARTLLEAKGAFEKNKVPPGVQAAFYINIGGKSTQLGAAPDPSCTFTGDVATTGKLTAARQLPKPGKAKAATNRIDKLKVLFADEP